VCKSREDIKSGQASPKRVGAAHREKRHSSVSFKKEQTKNIYKYVVLVKKINTKLVASIYIDV
jgi:hypothetical protein